MTQAIKEYKGLSVQQDSVEISDDVDTVELDDDDFSVTESQNRELDVTQKSIIPIFNSIDLNVTSTTSYYAIGAGQNTAASPLSFGATTNPPRTYSQSGVAQNLIVSAIGSSVVVTLTLMVNGADTLLSKQVTTSSTTWNYDIDNVNRVTISNGDYLTMKIVRSSGSLTFLNFYFEIVK